MSDIAYSVHRLFGAGNLLVEGDSKTFAVKFGWLAYKCY
jgi:hypothetical protein